MQEISVDQSMSVSHSGPDLALHISPPNSCSSDNIRPPPQYPTPNGDDLPEHVHGFDLWKQPPNKSSTDSESNVSSPRSPAYDNVEGASTVLCLANPPSSSESPYRPPLMRVDEGYVAHQFLRDTRSERIPDMKDFPAMYAGEIQDEFARRLTQMDHHHLHLQQQQHRVSPHSSSSLSSAIPELSLGRVMTTSPHSEALSRLQSYPMVSGLPRYNSTTPFEDSGGMQTPTLPGNLSTLIGYNAARHEGVYTNIGFRSRFPPRSPSKRSIRAPRMRWTSALHAHFVQAVELLGGHERKHTSLCCIKIVCVAHLESMS